MEDQANIIPFGIKLLKVAGQAIKECYDSFDTKEEIMECLRKEREKFRYLQRNNFLHIAEIEQVQSKLHTETEEYEEAQGLKEAYKKLIPLFDWEINSINSELKKLANQSNNKQEPEENNLLKTKKALWEETDRKLVLLFLLLYRAGYIDESTYKYCASIIPNIFNSGRHGKFKRDSLKVLKNQIDDMINNKDKDLNNEIADIIGCLDKAYTAISKDLEED